MEKKCLSCGQTKLISDFYPHKRMADGHLNKCKDCVKEYERQRRLNPAFREKILAYDRARGNRQDRDYLKQYRKKYPNKYLAHNLVNNAIRDERLFNEPCQVCGKEEGVHAHHDDYSKPLNIRWLCAAHHRQWHAKYGEALNP